MNTAMPNPLSFREIATLLLIKDAPAQVAMDRVELEMLLSRRLVSLARMACGRPRPTLTSEGDSVLTAIAHQMCSPRENR